METIAKILLWHFQDGKPIKEICRELGVSWKTVRKAIRSRATKFSYERTVQPQPKIGPWREELDRLLAENARRPKREHLTRIRIFEELRALGYEGGYDAVRCYAASWSQSEAEASAAAYMPLSFDPGEAFQFDWSHEVATIDGATTTIRVAHGCATAGWSSSGPIPARPKRWCSTPTTRCSPTSAAPAHGASMTT